MSRLIAWILFALSVVLAATGASLGLLGEQRGLELPPGRESMLVLELICAGAALLFGAVGLVIVRKRPENAIGWVFLISAPLFGLFGSASGYADLGLYGGEALPGAVWAAWMSWVFVVPVFVVPCLVALLFPDGRPVSPRWRWVIWAVLVAAAFEAIASAVHPGPMDQYPDAENPVALSGIEFGVVDAARPISGSLVFVVVLASLVVRYRRSRGVEREQLKWLAFAAALLVVGFLGATVAGTGLVSDLFFVLAIASVVFMPVAVAIAILRYRLYEIDRVISRTLVYGSLTVILGAAYAGLVLAGQAVFSSFAGGSNLAIAVSTLVVAALFLPVRSRVQGFVDRRFYRRRYDAQRTLEAFGARVREEVDLPLLSADLRGVVAETMQPAHVSLWLRQGIGR